MQVCVTLCVSLAWSRWWNTEGKQSVHQHRERQLPWWQKHGTLWGTFFFCFWLYTSLGGVINSDLLVLKSISLGLIKLSSLALFYKWNRNDNRIHQSCSFWSNTDPECVRQKKMYVITCIYFMIVQPVAVSWFFAWCSSGRTAYTSILVD